MNKLVTTALGLAVVGSIGAADPGDNDWLGLDSEISGLATSLTPTQGGGSGWSALLRSTYNFSSDDIATGGGDDVSGFQLRDVDLAFWGAAGDFGWRVSADLDQGNGIDLQDAYASFRCGDMVSVKMGQFKPAILNSNIIHPENQLFIDRTVLGSAYDGWDTGIGADGEQSGLAWSLAILDGQNGEISDHFYALRLSYAFGLGAGDSEGARGGNDDLNATLGASVIKDDSGSGPQDTQSVFVDFNGNIGAFGFGAEYGDIDTDGGRQVNPDIEVAARFQDLDNADDESLLSVGLNYYRPGNNSKWAVNVTDVSSDGDDGVYFQLGLVVGSSN